MDPIEAALKSLDDLEISLKEETSAAPAILTNKLKQISNNLKDVMESGRGMNDLALFPVSEELLRYLDSESLNLEVYRDKEFKDAFNKTSKIAERLHYLQMIKQEVGYKDEAK